MEKEEGEGKRVGMTGGLGVGVGVGKRVAIRIQGGRSKTRKRREHNGVD